MNINTPSYLKHKINIISKDVNLLKLFTKLLKVIDNNYTNEFFNKKNDSRYDFHTMSMRDNCIIDVYFKVNGYDITILNILIHDEWFSNL